LNDVRSFIAGERNSAAVTNSGLLYVWGASPHGHEDMLTPVMFSSSCSAVTKLEMTKEKLVALCSTVSFVV